VPFRFAQLPVLLVVLDPERDLLCRSLRALACQVRVARDTDEALAQVRGWEPRLVLVDVDLPGGEGFAAVRRLRGEAGPRARFVAVTGFADLTVRERSRHGGFDNFTLKPRNPDELRHYLRFIGVRPTARR
jgi:two-component system cell cycle response regulator DivK